MTTRIVKFTVFAFLAGSILFSNSSCRKSRLNKDTVSSEDNSTAENLFSDVADQAQESSLEPAVEQKSGKNACAFLDTSFTKGCKNIRVQALDSINCWPKRVTVDFGTTGCTGSDGRTRSGMIIVELTGPYRDSGTAITITLNNYKVNGYLIEGTKTVTNNGPNAGGNYTYTIVVTGGRVTAPDGSVVTWESTRTREWIAGYSTPLNVCDDVYLVTGNASGVDRQSRNYTITILTALRREICCRWFVSGTLKIVRDGLKDQEVDFGSGICDNQATVTAGSQTKTITLH